MLMMTVLPPARLPGRGPPSPDRAPVVRDQQRVGPAAERSGSPIWSATIMLVCTWTGSAGSLVGANPR